MYVQKMCRGGICPDPQFPILDYSEEEGKCSCRKHPCWSDSSLTQSCQAANAPYLHFQYNDNKTLSCDCRPDPQYDTPHVAKDKCAGQFCANANFSILDWSPEENKCFCRKHPCRAEDNLLHECTDPTRPILHFAFATMLDNVGGALEVPMCQCLQKPELPAAKGLRGAAEQQPQVCTKSM